MNRTAFEEILKNDVNHLKGLLQIEGGRFVIEKLESPNKGETSIYRSYSAENVDDLSFKNRLINDFIFRDCDLKAISFINVDFENTIFENCKIEFARFYNCSFTSTKFLNTKIKNTGLGLSYRGSNSMFKDVTFNHCHIEKLGFDSPLFSKCNFEESKIMDVEFNGSVFEDCKFTGKIIDSFFRGVYVHPPQRQAILEVFNKKREYGANKMKNVDFSGAELVGVEFSKGIDLHTMHLPNDK